MSGRARRDRSERAGTCAVLPGVRGRHRALLAGRRATGEVAQAAQPGTGKSPSSALKADRGRGSSVGSTILYGIVLVLDHTRLFSRGTGLSGSSACAPTQRDVSRLASASALWSGRSGPAEVELYRRCSLLTREPCQIPGTQAHIVPGGGSAEFRTGACLSAELWSSPHLYAAEHLSLPGRRRQR